MMSTPLIVTPLWPSICKPMNSLEVLRIAGFYTDLSKKYSGVPFQYNSANLSTINTVQVIILQL